MGESIEPIVVQELDALGFDLVELRRGVVERLLYECVGAAWRGVGACACGKEVACNGVVRFSFQPAPIDFCCLCVPAQPVKRYTA